MISKAIFVFLFALLQVQFNLAASVAELEKGEEECVAELSLDRDAIIKWNRPNIAPEDNPDNFNDFIGCYYKKQQWVNDENEVDVKNFSKYILGELVPGNLSEVNKIAFTKLITEEIEKCHAGFVKGETAGATAVKWQNCIIKHITERLKELGVNL